MKVLLYNDFGAHVGGVETYVQQITNGLREQGVQVENLSFFEHACEEGRTFKKVNKLIRRHLPDKQVIQLFHQKIESIKPDIIHLQNNKCFTASILTAAAQHDIPIISSFHDHHFIHSPTTGYKRLTDSLHFPILRQMKEVSSRIICHSQRMQIMLQSFGFETPTYVPYFVDLATWDFHPEIHKNPYQLAFVGRLHPDKGIFVGLEMVSQLLPVFPELKLICIGEGRYRSKLEKEINKRGVDNHVQLLGYQSHREMLTYLHQCRGMIMPSVYEEMFGMAGIEAQAAGLPVIASQVGGVMEWCQHGKTGYLVPPNDASTLAQAVSELFRNPIHAKKLALQARNKVETSFSKSLSIQMLIQVYEQTIYSLPKSSHPKTFPKIPSPAP